MAKAHVDLEWKLIQRKKVFSSRFVNVYEDKVELPNGKIINDYTVVEKPSIVLIVATDSSNRILILREYKYAAGKYLLSLPAGHIKHDEKPLAAAKRELLEETGFGGDFEELGILHDYPTKDLHKVYVVRAKNITQKGQTSHEETESITHEFVSIPQLKKQIHNKKWQICSSLAAIALSGLLS